MRLGYKICVTIIIVLLVIVSSIGRSYALWTISEKQADPNVVVSGCLNVIYNDKSEENNVTSINLTNTYPLKDEFGKKLKPYKITIKNECTLAANYNIYISSFLNNTLSDEYLKIYFTRLDDNTIWEPQSFNELNPFELDNSLKNELELDEADKIKSSHVLASGVLNPTETKTYELRLWVSADAPNNTMGKKFKSIVYMYASATENHL